MAKIWEPKDKDILTSWILACLEVETELSKWEYDFILSLQEQLEHKSHLSERQEEILERIYAERTH